MSKKTYDKEIMHCYRQLYAHSTPAASFDELVENAKVNEVGQKQIDFMSYEIDESLAIDIINQTIKDFKIKPKYKQQQFRTTIYLGCSPKFKRDGDNN
jgi:hypothetical protein